MPQQPSTAPAASGGTAQDGRRPWWTAGRVIAAIVLVLVLMSGAGVVGFFAGAAWSGVGRIGEDFVGDLDLDVSGGVDGPTTTGEPVRLGDSLTGSLDGDAVEHPLTVETSTEVTVAVRSDDFDTTLTVVDEAGDELAYNDDIEFGQDRNSEVEVTLDPGTYGLVVDAFGSGEGSYELEVR